MRTGTGENTYEWIGNWANVPDSESARRGWAHPGMVVTDSGEVITCHSGDHTVLFFDGDGRLVKSWDGDFSDAHGITLVRDGLSEQLWIADNGSKRHHTHGYDYPPGADQASGRVFKTTLDGEVVNRLPKPDHPAYATTRYAPTTVAVNEERYGGNGDIWVGDGYGASLVHRFSETGKYIATISGEEGAGAFNCPHGIFIDRRGPDAELYVADRTNHRVQVYDLEGKFKRAFGSDFLSSPSGFVTHGNLLVVAELRARLAVLDKEDNLLCYLGETRKSARLTVGRTTRTKPVS